LLDVIVLLHHYTEREIFFCRTDKTRHYNLLSTQLQSCTELQYPVQSSQSDYTTKHVWTTLDAKFLQRCCWRFVSSGTEVTLHRWVNIHRHFGGWHCLIFKVQQSSWTLCAGTGTTAQETWTLRMAQDLNSSSTKHS